MSQEGDSFPVAQAVGTVDQLYRRLAELIEQGQFAEGSRLPAEGDLAEQFGVSRYLVREALGRLRIAGVIVSRKGSGSFVRKRFIGDLEPPPFGLSHIDSIAQIKSCYEFRIGLEGEAAYLAAQNRNVEALRKMQAALDRIESAIVDGIVGKDADFDFHLAVARGTGNGFYFTVMETMRTPIEFGINLGRSLSLRRPKHHLQRIQAEHVAIFTAIEAGDKEAARRAMRAHLTEACDRMFNGPDYENLLVRSPIADGLNEFGPARGRAGT